MKKAPLFTALCSLALILTACASRSTDGATNGFGNGSSSGNGSGFGSSFRSGAARTLTPDAKLALGTMKLEGTPQAIDTQTAAKLLPLWQLMMQLHSSSSTAPQEVAAVQNQIEETMTAAQVSAINGMTLTTADLFSLLQSQAQASNGSGGGTGGFGSNGSSGRNDRGGGGRVFFGGGPGGFAGGPGGGFGGGFGGGGFRTTNGNGTSSSAQQLTPEEQAQALQARENAISSLVESQLIRLLETKLGSRPG